MISKRDEYIQKIKNEWVCPKDIKHDKVVYAFMYEFAVLMEDTVGMIFAPNLYDVELQTYKTQLSIDDLERFLNLYKRFGVYQIDTLYDHFEVHAVAFDLQFSMSESGYLHEVIITTKTIYGRVYGYDERLSIDFVKDAHICNMLSTEWMSEQSNNQ